MSTDAGSMSLGPADPTRGSATTGDDGAPPRPLAERTGATAGPLVVAADAAVARRAELRLRADAATTEG